jgi:peptidoglycan/LPS O-acetylase OafA/YrhL
MGNPKDYIPTLDGWRAIAITAVLVCHGFHGFFGKLGPYPNQRLQAYVTQGHIGVDCFFAISGYLICHRLLSEKTSTGRISLFSFYFRRAFRILPAYFLYLLVIGFFAHFGYLHVSTIEWASCLCFFRNLLPDSAMTNDRWYLSHLWSLSVEEQFYLIWPVFLIILKTRQQLVFGLISAAFVAFYSPSIVIEMNGHLVHPVPKLDGLIWGALLAISLRNAKFEFALRKILCAELSIAFLLVLTILGVSNRIPNGSIWIPMIFPLIIASTVLHPSKKFSRFLELPSVRWVGQISYSLYIWQQLFLIMEGSPLIEGLEAVQYFPLAFVATFICALLSFYLIEKPMIQLGRTWLARSTGNAHS